MSIGIGDRTFWSILAFLVILGGCSTSGVFRSSVFRKTGVYHTIRPGETLYRISRTYGVDLDELVKVNHIFKAGSITKGTRLYIPGAKQVLIVPKRKKRVVLSPTKSPKWPRRRVVRRNHTSPSLDPAETKKLSKNKRKGLRRLARVTLPAEVDFVWPIKGKLISVFNNKGRQKHQGIDIASVVGASVLAAEDGFVLFSGKGPGGYGNMVVLRHVGGFHTIYAHNSKNKVKKGDKVRQSEVIALVGGIRGNRNPHVHFEIRFKTKPKDPLFYLP